MGSSLLRKNVQFRGFFLCRIRVIPRQISKGRRVDLSDFAENFFTYLGYQKMKIPKVSAPQVQSAALGTYLKFSPFLRFFSGFLLLTRLGTSDRRWKIGKYIIFIGNFPQNKMASSDFLYLCEQTHKTAKRQKTRKLTFLKKHIFDFFENFSKASQDNVLQGD